MRSLLLSLVLLGGPLAASSAAFAAGPTPTARATVETAESRLDAWRAARARTRGVRLEQAALARRIEALDRPGGGPAGGALQELLRRSLAVEDRLEAALEAEADARGEVTRAVRGGVRKIDRQIRAAVPRLKAGPMADRRAAARHINQLRAARQALRTVLAQLDARDGDAPRASWARYEVTIEPLDGPTELEEKADFVEDTRDKLRRKRRALGQLLAEAKQEREIARAARDFDTYVRLFDEEARTDRVTRQGGGAAALASDDSSNRGGAPTQEFAAGGATNNANPATPDPGLETPPTDTVGNNDGLTSGGGGGRGGGVGAEVPPSAPADPGVTAISPGASRDIDADVLINLRVNDLAAQGLDLVTLERLVAELEALDGYLDAQSRTIRKRAKDIEEDEAKALGTE